MTTEIYALTAYPDRICEPEPVFDFCIQDESNGNLLKFNSTTGNYQFTNCSTLTLNGTASIIDWAVRGPDVVDACDTIES